MSADGLAQKHQPTKPREIDALESVRPGRLRRRNGRMMRVVESLRSDNDPEFTAQAIRDWLKTVGVKTLYVEPGSPWENGYCESFNGKIFDSLKEARIVIEQWRQQYNRVRPHAALRYRPPSAGGLYPTWEPGTKVSNHNVIGLTSLGTKSRPGHWVAAGRLEGLEKVLVTVPSELVRRTRDDFLDAFLEARRDSPEVTAEKFLARFDEIPSLLEKLGIKLYDSTTEEIIGDRDVARECETINQGCIENSWLG